MGKEMGTGTGSRAWLLLSVQHVGRISCCCCFLCCLLGILHAYARIFTSMMRNARRAPGRLGRNLQSEASWQIWIYWMRTTPENALHIEAMPEIYENSKQNIFLTQGLSFLSIRIHHTEFKETALHVNSISQIINMDLCLHKINYYAPLGVLLNRSRH